MVTVEHIWSAILSLLLALFARLHVTERERIETLKDDLNKTRAETEAIEQALAAHKLFAAENFVRNIALEKVEQRIMARLDEIKAELRARPGQH